jgi:hypothetical protein
MFFLICLPFYANQMKWRRERVLPLASTRSLRILEAIVALGRKISRALRGRPDLGYGPQVLTSAMLAMSCAQPHGRSPPERR